MRGRRYLPAATQVGKKHHKTGTENTKPSVTQNVSTFIITEKNQARAKTLSSTTGKRKKKTSLRYANVTRRRIDSICAGRLEKPREKCI
jgi:hypothetical protein